MNTYYINKIKQNVLLSHNKAYLYNYQFEFDENKLLIDLSGSESKNKEPYQLLLLYSPQIKNTKLISYHTSKKNAVFFFFYRKEYNNE